MNNQPGLGMDNFETRFQRVEDQVSQLASSVSAVSANVNSLAQTIQQVVANQRPAGVNWGWVLSGVIALGGFIGLYVVPVEAGVRSNENRIRDIEIDRFTSSDGRLIMDRIYALEVKIQANELLQAQELTARAKWMGTITERINAMSNKTGEVVVP